MRDSNSKNIIDAETLREDGSSFDASETKDSIILCLGIIWHADPARIGATVPLHFDKTGKAELSRLAPKFLDNDTPLMDIHLSRSPLVIERQAAGRFRFYPPDSPTTIRINGQMLDRARSFSMSEKGEEIVIRLSNAVILSMFNAPARYLYQKSKTDFGLLGISRTIAMTRDLMVQIADLDVPVLIRGETGTGKELVARGIHHASSKTTAEMVSVNMATITPSLAAAELFGAKKGAFTGATADSRGLFEQADGGILFLDEIGDTAANIQPMLLRVLESGEIRRVGDDKVKHVKVRTIAATDRSLAPAGGKPTFNEPLLRRLEGVTINIAPLRNRRIDIGILLRKFLLSPDDQLPVFPLARMPMDLMERLALHDWPGNVRELWNSARTIRLGQPVLTVEAESPDPEILPAALSGETVGAQKQQKRKYRHPDEIDQIQLVEALDSCNWIIKDAAERLGISRTSLYQLMSKSQSVRQIADLDDDEIRAVMATVDGGLDKWVKHLRVGRESLKKRVAELRISRRQK